MKTSEKLAVGLIAGAGALWGTRALIRRQRWMELSGRVVVITGSDSGFGLILARHVAEHGARLVLAARNADTLNAAAEDVRSAGAAEVLAVPTDVSKEDQSDRLIRETVERFGRIDVLINNAGLMIVAAEPTLTLDDYRSLMATNFWGAVYTSRSALPHMRRQKSGRIANVSSVGGRVVVPHMLPYIASKHALTGYTKALRAEASRDNVLVGHSHCVWP